MKVLLFICSLFLLFNVANSAELEVPTETLNGTSIKYEYTSGRAYNVRFEIEGLSYRYLTGVKPEKWWGPFPYKAFEIEDKVFMVSWFEEGYIDHVTLLINFENNLIYGSALIAGKSLHFHGAKLYEVVRPQ